MNRESEWVDAPENETEDSYVACRAAFERLVRLAEKIGCRHRHSKPIGRTLFARLIGPSDS